MESTLFALVIIAIVVVVLLWLISLLPLSGRLAVIKAILAIFVIGIAFFRVLAYL